MASVLLVEDDRNARRLMALGLEEKGHEVTSCTGPDEAMTALTQDHFDVVLTDLRMEGRDAGLDVVQMSVCEQPEARVLLVTAYASAETAVEALKQGAFDYLTKPVSGEDLAQAVECALADIEENRGQGTEDGERRAGDRRGKNEGLIGQSIAIRRVRERLLRAARRDFTVLISGESGTGKEIAARFVHTHSGRSSGPFVPVHCGAIPFDLFESELFGHVRGAFTGAESDRIGLMESANGGTLFLDEIGDMPLAVQVKLLRALQDHRVRRVGAEEERKVDIRIVAASNRDLDAEVKHGGFRQDLFYRLNVVPVHMPPLRQRREDIPLLVDHFLTCWSQGGKPLRLAPDAMKKLASFPLPGNVRELENLLQRMIALADGSLLPSSVLDELRTDETPEKELSLQQLQEDDVNLDDALGGVERRLVRQALDESHGSITRAAKLLGISFRSLRYRLRKLGVKTS
ncbi:MAG: sigma-54 dependent transcriptional regulator [Mariprofundaceae bacterium]|nr:sigma-54 dependent transcriptional regulator [Mariprofundaceae bacterium]